MLGFGGLQLPYFRAYFWRVSAGCEAFGALTIMDVYSDSVILVLKETA